MKDKDGYIYLIRQKNTSYYKIGFTQDERIESRLTNLQVGNPFELEIIGSFYTFSQMTEQKLNQFFSEKYVHGEWFNLTNEDAIHILNCEWRQQNHIYTHETELIIQALTEKLSHIQQLNHTFLTEAKQLLYYQFKQRLL
jgi:hypothetical protein